MDIYIYTTRKNLTTHTHNKSTHDFPYVSESSVSAFRIVDLVEERTSLLPWVVGCVSGRCQKESRGATANIDKVLSIFRHVFRDRCINVADKWEYIVFWYGRDMCCKSVRIQINIKSTMVYYGELLVPYYTHWHICTALLENLPINASGAG